jgi:hypothetical protein
MNVNGVKRVPQDKLSKSVGLIALPWRNAFVAKRRILCKSIASSFPAFTNTRPSLF